MDEFSAPSMDEFKIEYSPIPAVAGEWVIIAIEKVYNNSSVRNVTDDHRFGFNIVAPFGREILVALPLVDNPKDDVPEGAITLAQFQSRVIKPIANLSRAGIQSAAAPIKFS